MIQKVENKKASNILKTKITTQKFTKHNFLLYTYSDSLGPWTHIDTNESWPTIEIDKL